MKSLIMCPHARWRIHGYEQVNCATCSMCGNEVSLVVLFNGLAERLFTLEDRLTTRLKKSEST